MADPTTDTGLLPRTYFRAPRVPFDFRAVAIAVLGYLVYWGGAYLLGEAFDPVSPIEAFFDRFFEIIRGIPFIGEPAERFFDRVFVPVEGTQAGTFWHALVGGTWTFLVWAFFGQAIHRIISLRIARDEGLSIKEALAFAAKNFATIALCPLIIAAAIALFYGCNALAGLFISIPVLGPILAYVLLPLAVISTLIIVLIAIGGVIGMPLVAAAAAWERNGSLDAISRAFSYVFARPLQFFWNYLLIFLFTGIILLVGFFFVVLLTKSVDAGMLRETPSMIVNTPAFGSPRYEKYSEETKTLYAEIGRETAQQPYAISFEAVDKAPWSSLDKVGIFAFWVVLNLILVSIMGYAIYWFLGATTSTYADLRADVDGTEEDEIYLEEEEEDFEALAKGDAGTTVGTTPAPTPDSTPPPPPSGSSGPDQPA
jgi:hypothetical protein